MEDIIQQRKKLENILAEKASKDKQFRNQLVNNPKETIGNEFGIKIPDSLNITVLQEDASTFYLILPSVVNLETGHELSEAELQQVSGGNLFDTQCSTWSWILTQCDACG